MDGFGFVLLILILASCGPKALVAPPPPAPSQAPQEQAIPHQPRTIAFTIQVGAFKDQGRAAVLAERLQESGVDAFHFIDTDGLSKVRFERFATHAEALARARTLQARGLIEAFFIAQPDQVLAAYGSVGAVQQSLVSTARRFLGSPYRYGNASAQEGFDCSGLTMTVYRLHGLELPRTSLAQFYSGRPVGKHELEAGDLVFFATGKDHRVSHVGIYSGHGQFIHAAAGRQVVRTASLASTYFSARYMGARRYF